MINLQNLSFSYDGEEKILNQINVEVVQGEFIVLCGESGCGKSTLLRMIDGLIPELYEGKITGKGTILDQDLYEKTFNTFVKEIGVVFQNPKTQFFTSDVYSELAFSMENYGFDREEIVERLNEIASLFSIGNLLDKSMFHLSGGQKQLIAFASACMLKHRLFLLDEPSSNLDEVTIKRLKEYLYLLKKMGMTIIVSEHRLYYLSELADRYLVMDQGKIIQNYTEKEMFALADETVKNMSLRALHQTRIEKRTTNPIEMIKNQSILRVEELEFSYRKKPLALSIPYLELSNKWVTGIIGPNGAGKSTFSKLISGLLKPQKGRIYFDDQEMTTKKLINESFVVMQDVNLQLFFETVEKELQFKGENKDAFEKVVDMLQLNPLLSRHPQTLSGGEKQRVAIASALLSGKKFILFDEPTSGLDLKHMEEVSETIDWLQKKGILVLVITHDKEFLKCTCQRILEFDKGLLKADFFIK